MLARNRTLSILTSVGYLLTITVAALFHNHGGVGRGGGLACRAAAKKGSAACCRNGCDEGRPSSSNSQPSSDDDNCQVCQFLAQKPAPAVDVQLPMLETAVDEAIAPSPCNIATVAFAAWRSRAPPTLS